jgi:hypothetical protein
METKTSQVFNAAQKCVLKYLQLDSFENLKLEDVRLRLRELPERKLSFLFEEFIAYPIGITKTNFCKLVNINQGNFAKYLLGKKHSSLSHNTICDFFIDILFSSNLLKYSHKKSQIIGMNVKDDNNTQNQISFTGKLKKAIKTTNSQTYTSTSSEVPPSTSSGSTTPKTKILPSIKGYLQRKSISLTEKLYFFDYSYDYDIRELDQEQYLCRTKHDEKSKKGFILRGVESALLFYNFFKQISENYKKTNANTVVVFEYTYKHKNTYSQTEIENIDVFVSGNRQYLNKIMKVLYILRQKPCHIYVVSRNSGIIDFYAIPIDCIDEVDKYLDRCVCLSHSVIPRIVKEKCIKFLIPFII